MTRVTDPAPRISEDELARLEELAGKATPGPWRGTTEGSYDQRHAAAKAFETVMARRLADNPDAQFSDLSWVRTEGDDYLNVALIGNGKDGPENAAYIAALSPDVVLRLLAAARSAPATGLDAAWAEAEAALPEGAALVRLTWRIGMHERFPPDEDFEARAEWWYGNERPVESRYGPTPAAALLALAAALREPKP